MTTLIRNRQFITLCLLTLCFFASPISVTVTTITYCASFFCVLISGDWQSRWQSIQCNRAAWSFWILFFLFLVGASYSTSPWRLIFFDIQKRHWLLITPFLMMVMQDALWRRRMINAFLSSMIVTLLFAYAHYFFKVNITGKTSNLDLSTDIVFAFHIVQSFAMNIAAFICAYRTLFEKKCRWCYAVNYFVKRWANGLYYFYFDFCLSGSYSFWMARRSDHDSDCFCNDVKCLWSISQFSISREFNDSTYDTLLHNISHQWCWSAH